MRVLFLVFVTMVSLTAFAQRPPHRIYPAYCQDGDLYSNTHTLLYSFNFSLDCNNALRESKLNNGRFCDDTKLIREDGVLSYNFTFRSDCQEGLLDLSYSKSGLFCDDSILSQLYSGVILEMTFYSECKTAVEEARRFKGLFCYEGVMITNFGKRLKDYTLQSECRRQLPIVGQTISQ